MRMEGVAAVELRNLYKIYSGREVETVALQGANLSVTHGEFLAIRGRSGSGKSTLLNLIGGLDQPDAGQVVLNGVEITHLHEGERAAFRRSHIGTIYQQDNLIPFLTALENVLLPMELAARPGREKRAQELLAEVGLKERLHHRPAQLSGGERQRVAIAAALANEPDLLLADELTGELDSATADQVMKLLAQLNREHGLTLVVVTHNLRVAAQAQRQVEIRDGLMGGNAS